MDWLLKNFSGLDSMYRRVCGYLIENQLGEFLKGKPQVGKISVLDGHATINDVQINVEKINVMLEEKNVPVQLVDGFIESIKITFPGLKKLTTENTVVEIRCPEFTFRPCLRDDPTGVMLESMFESFSSMTTSKVVAEECLRQENEETNPSGAKNSTFEGLDAVASMIDTIFTRVKVHFTDILLRIEHVPKDAKTGAAFEVKIQKLCYQDTNADAPPDNDDASSGEKKLREPVAAVLKRVNLTGVELFCDEIPAVAESTGAGGVAQPSSPSDVVSELQRKMEADAGGAEDGVYDKEPIKIAVLRGVTELTVKMKQNKELPGPKLDIDVALGSVNVHLSPRQLHLLIEIASAISTPGPVEESGRQRRSASARSRPMGPDDYARFHEDMIDAHMGQLRMQMADTTDEGLVTTALSEGDEVYFSYGRQSMDGSFVSSASSHTSPSVAGSGVSQQTSISSPRTDSGFPATSSKPRHVGHSKAKDSLHKLLDDPAAELSRYRVRVSFLSAALLHEDPPEIPSNGLDAGTTSRDRLAQMAALYFGRVVGIGVTGGGGGAALAAARAEFMDACPVDHIGLLAKPLMLECNSKTSSAVSSTSADVTVGVMEVVEVLYDRRAAKAPKHMASCIKPECYELLTFGPEDEFPPGGAGGGGAMFNSLHAGVAAGSPASPCVRVKLDVVHRKQLSHRSAAPAHKTDVHIELAKCCAELDITIVDRVHSLLNPVPLTQKTSLGALGPSVYQSCYQSPSSAAEFSHVIDEIDAPASSDHRTDLKVTAANILLKFRFPIPDLRDNVAAEVKQWWRRHLRQESLILDVADAEVTTSFSPDNSVDVFEITCRDAHGLLEEAAGKVPVSFLRVGAREGATSGRTDADAGFDLPRIVIRLYPEQSSVLEEEVEDDYSSLPHPDSLNGACNFPKPPTSPFSSRKVIYESEEMVLPGDRVEMAEFQEKAVSHTRMVIDLNLPNVNARLPDKDFLELLYNRFVNDLVLWAPTAPAPVELPISAFQDGGLKFSMVKSALLYDSSSDEDEEEEALYSIHNYKGGRKTGGGAMPKQSKMAFVLNIGHGRITCCSPLKDEAGCVRRDQHGEFLMELGDAALTLVSQFNGDPELSYLAVQSHTASLYHNGCVAVPSLWPPLERAGYGPPPQHLKPCLYPSDAGVPTNLSGKVGEGGECEDQLSVAVSIQLDRATDVKQYVVAFGVRGTTLRHIMSASQHNWLMQLLEVFDLRDEDIAGYKLPQIITELHCHIWSCAIDYRPVALPYRTLVILETFSISSNIIAESQASLLRFMVDDAALYLSDRLDVKEVNVKKNYVCVLDVGMFVLSMRTTDGKDPKYPAREVKATNSVVNLRTCADSLHALSELIQYIASDGDTSAGTYGRSAEDRAQPDFSIYFKGIQRAETASSPPPPPPVTDSPQLTRSCHEQVHDLMADAMLESDTSDEESKPVARRTHGGRLYFEPPSPRRHSSSSSASNTPSSERRRQALEAAMMSSELDDSTSSLGGGREVLGIGGGGAMAASVASEAYHSGEDEDESDDEEFCIISDEPGIGILPRDGEPKIRVHTTEPIVIKDNYFKQPLGKTDLLRAPENFPTPVNRYTLSEMSVVWHMFGGTDFTSSPPTKYKQQGRRVVRKKKTEPVCTGKEWQAAGGPGRDHNLLTELHLSKVRLQHEQYPDSTEQAARQVLLIKDVEIRDKLATSQINKLLYRLSCDKIPLQTQANMLLIKALHVRPDLATPAQEECSLRVSMQPIRLNIDQDTMFFLKTFFTEISGPTDAVEAEIAGGSTESDTPRPNTPPPVMQVSPPLGEAVEEDPVEQVMFDEMSDDDEEDEDPSKATPGATPTPAAAQPVFFKSFEFSPDVIIQIDYNGKHIDRDHGTIIGLIIGLGKLNNSKVILKRFHHKRGLKGVPRVLQFATSYWVQDIRKNQIQNILGGVGPMHSFVQLFQGVYDLFWLPVEQYQRDGRLVRGMQRGANSFMTCTAMSTLELTNKLVNSVQYVAELSYNMVSPLPASRKARRRARRREQQELRRGYRLHQPADFREGMSSAFTVLREYVGKSAFTLFSEPTAYDIVMKKKIKRKKPRDLHEGIINASGIIVQGFKGTAENLMKVAVEEHEEKGVTGAVGGVLRQMPPTIISPVIIATEATSNILGGMRNQLLPDKRREDEDKWKPEEDDDDD